MATDFPLTINIPIPDVSDFPSAVSAPDDYLFVINFNGQIRTYDDAFNTYDFPFGANWSRDGHIWADGFTGSATSGGITMGWVATATPGGLLTITFTPSVDLTVRAYPVNNYMDVTLQAGVSLDGYLIAGATDGNAGVVTLTDTGGNPGTVSGDLGTAAVRVGFPQFVGYGGDIGGGGGGTGHPNILLWTFELDGHEYLVVPLQEETLIYDFLMSQWYVWGNDSTPIWAGQHGQNWNANLGTVLNALGGNRVSNTICGDRETGALYFLDPELNEDYSNAGVPGQPFQRIITGQILSRSSSYTPLAQVEVTASDGDAVTASDMTVDLQYSDDRGVTYASFGVRTVVPDEFGIQLQWRSLGGYRTPGRLLKLIDYGALVRVDDWTVPDADG